MASTVDELQIKISAKFDELQTGIDQAQRKIDQLSNTAKTDFSKIDGAAKGTEQTLMNAVNAMIDGLNRTTAETRETAQSFSAMAANTDAALGKIAASVSEVAVSLDAFKAKTQAVGEETKKTGEKQKEQGSILSGIMSSWIVQIAAVTAAFKAVDFFGNQIQAGIQFNSTLEEAQLGIASLITAQANLKTATGETLTGHNALVAAQALAVEQMDKLQVAGIQTSATTQQLATAFQQAVGAGMSAGLNLDQIRELTVSITQAAGALGVPMDQLNQEVVSILNGTIDMNSRVAKNLSISNEMITSWKQQGTLAEELNKKFESFGVAGDEIAKQWGSVTSNLDQARDTVAGMATAGMMEALKKGFNDVIAGIIETDGKTLKLNTDMQRFAEEIGKGLTAAGRTAANAMLGAIDAMKTIGKWLKDHEEGLKIVSKLWEAQLHLIGSIANAVGTVAEKVLHWETSSSTLLNFYEKLASLIEGIANRIDFIVNKATTLGQVFDALSGAPMPMAKKEKTPTVSYENVGGTGQSLRPITKANPWADLMSAKEKEYGLPIGLLNAQAWQESKFNPNAKSGKDAGGLMQFIPGTAKQYGIQDRYNPEQSIEGAAKYMQHLLKMFNGNLELALAGYNAGEKNVIDYKGVPPFKETRNYVKEVMSNIPKSGETTSPSNLTLTPKNPPPEDKALIDAQTRAQIQQIQTVTETNQRSVEQRTALNEAGYQRGKISADQYYATIETLDKEATNIALSGAEKQLSVYREKLAKEKEGSKEYLSIQGQVVTIENQIAQIRSAGSIKALKDQTAAAQNQKELADESRRSEIQRIQETEAADQRAIQHRKQETEGLYQQGKISAQTYYSALQAIDEAQSKTEISSLEKQIQLIREKHNLEVGGTREYIQTENELITTINRLNAAKDRGALSGMRAQQQSIMADIGATSERTREFQRARDEELAIQLDANQQMFSMGQISHTQQIENEKNLQRSIAHSKMQALELAMRNYEKESTEYRKLAAEKERIEKRSVQAINHLNAQQFTELKGHIQGALSVIGNGFANTITGMITGAQTFHQGMVSMLQNLLSMFLEFMANMLVEWIATQIAELIIGQTTSKTKIMGYAGEAAAASYASVAAIPYVGWAMAPAVSETAFATVASYALSARGGFDIPAGINPMTQLHEREMVLPAKHADVIRKMADTGGGQAQASAPVTVNISAVDAKGVKDLFHKHGATMVDVLRQQHRGFNRVVPA